MLQKTKNDLRQLVEKTIIPIEGGYVNNPADAGGPTMWGITERLARKYGYTGDMQDLPKDTAIEIYIQEFIIALGYVRVLEISPAIGEELIEAGINVRYREPARWLQRTLNVANQMQKLYPDLKVDGVIGNVTTNALATLLYYRGKKEGEKFVLGCLNHLQGVYYIERAEQRELNETFLYGWIMNRTL